jgi:predicted GTPase
MNDKIKKLLENAEQSDAIAINKWRIENREQLRKERKEKLKELMEKDKQQYENSSRKIC